MELTDLRIPYQNIVLADTEQYIYEGTFRSNKDRLHDTALYVEGRILGQALGWMPTRQDVLGEKYANGQYDHTGTDANL